MNNHRPPARSPADPGLEKHRNANGTYDGIGVMSELTSLPRDEIRAIAEQVKANGAKLNGCAYHEFEQVPHDQGTLAGKPAYRCQHCGGEIDLIRYRWHESGRRPARINPEPPAMSITWYDTPEQVHRAMWEEGAIANGMTYEEMIAESTCVGEDFAGNEHEVTHEQEMAGIRTQGCWAFVDTRVNMIHAWADPEADRELVLHMLAHEIGHVTGAEHPDPIQEEMRADQFGRVAKLAYQLLQQRKASTDSMDAVLASYGVKCTGGARGKTCPVHGLTCVVKP